ncbi:MAG TPA: helicase-related protein [Candidatus Eremiobacteraeota bacterium]|nr:MAG: ATP-dependent RNA helicase HrpB [bacterium ADurb.Bin363]HPZ07882.1 helicase-related protein [Candidatus Eremiobacteraeota bacterium]
MELGRRLADFAEQLPIGKKLGELDFTQTGILIGETACGKSMVTPVLAHLTGGFKRIIVRQPTRLASYLAMKSMEDIYGKTISVGCINRDQKINPDAPILEITDGILVDWLRDKQIWYDELIILDEIHATSEQLEIAMGLIKRQGFRPWCLSATIDPRDIRDYFNAEVYYVSGINYPIHKKQIYKPLTDFLYGDKIEKGYIKDKIISKGHSCLVFLPTRFETELWAAEIEEVYGEDIICKYLHGGINVQEMEPFAHKENIEKPFILFATPVAEQSITLDLDDVIIVNEKIFVTEYMGVKRQQRIPLPPNSLIQMMGRCGRYREGQVYVISDRFDSEINFEHLHPTLIDYTLANNTPFELAIILADRKVKLEDIELITDVDRKEYNFAVKMLKKRKIIDKHGQLTKEGEVVMNIPLDYNLAQFVATAPEEILDIVIFTASFGTHGLYHLEKFFPDGTPFDIIRARQKLSVSQSDLLTKYNIARTFYGLSEEEMDVKAQELGMNLHVIINSLNAAKSVYEHLELSPPENLPELNKELISIFQEHVFNIMLFPPIKVSYNYNRGSYSCYIDNLKAFVDIASTIQGGMEEIIFSSKTEVENRRGEWFIRLSDNTLCPKKLREWCWPEETVKKFLQEILIFFSDESYIKVKKRYPHIIEFVKKSTDLTKKLEVLYNKSPESFKKDRIMLMEILEDILGDICIQERIKNFNTLEEYLAKKLILEPDIEEFISYESIKKINGYPDEIEIRESFYPIIYKKGEKLLELPYQLILDLKEEESRGINIFTSTIQGKNKKIEKIYSCGLLQAQKDIKSLLTKKAWKKANKASKDKIKLNQIPNILTKLLSKKHVTDFCNEPIYGWTGLEYDGNNFNLKLFNSSKEAELEIRKSLIEYINRKLRIQENEIKKKLPSKNRRKIKKDITSEIKKLLKLSKKEIENQSFNINSQESLRNLWAKLEPEIYKLRKFINRENNELTGLKRHSASEILEI